MSVGQRWGKDGPSSIQLRYGHIGSFDFEDLFDDEVEQKRATIPETKITLFFSVRQSVGESLSEPSGELRYRSLLVHPHLFIFKLSNLLIIFN